jgi:hypothetical protein
METESRAMDNVQNCDSYTIIGAVFSTFCVNWTVVPKIIVYEFELNFLAYDSNSQV